MTNLLCVMAGVAARRNYPILVLAHRTRRTQGCWGHAGQPPLLSMLSRATWALYARSPVQPIPIVLGGSPDGGLELRCGGYTQVPAPRLCGTAGGLASSNIPSTLLTARVGAIP
jgi:hypothetical protein